MHDRPARFERPDEGAERGGRDERGDRPERNGPDREPRDMPAPTAAASVADLPASELAEEPVRRRRSRPPRSEAAVESAEPDATPDGAAALAAFPE
jgi:hypothetical protein